MAKLVHIRKYSDSWGIRRAEIDLLGIKIRFPYGNWKAYLQKRKQRRREKRKKRFEKKTAAFRAANHAYITHKKDCTIRRLFITTGNLQLLNALAIILQLAEEETVPSENYVMVWSYITNDEFEKTSREIASLCGVRHYYSICGEKYDADRVIKFIDKQKLVQIDEVYSLRLVFSTTIFEKLYRNAKYILMDEGGVSLVPIPVKIPRYCEKMISTFFLNKLDYVSFPGRPWAVEHIQQKYFSIIAHKCAALYPWKIPHFDSQKKYVIFCGNYTAFFSPYTEDEMESRQNHIIQALNDRGFHVLYKPHPRDPVKRENHDGLTILHTRLPLECYQLEGIYAVISLCSAASTQSYHYSKVAGFIDPIFCSKAYAPHLAILMNEYTPPIDLLLEVDARGKEPTELHREIERRYEMYMADKPLLSQNEKFNSVYHPLLKNTK